MRGKSSVRFERFIRSEWRKTPNSRKDGTVKPIQSCFDDRSDLSVVELLGRIWRNMEEIEAEFVFIGGLASSFEQSWM